MLDKFRKIGVVWNHSTNRIYQPMRVASSDDRGRKLVVQVINDSVLENTQEVELRLYWEIKDKNGFNDFELIDAEHGIYEVYFSRGMLENKGTHKSWLHATDTTGSVTSEVFGIEVFSGIDLEAVEGTDDFSALNSALVRVVAIESQEEERLDNEKARKRAEDLRQTQEDTRQTQEGARERGEADRNTKYGEAETARDRKYDSREDGRDTKYEAAEKVRERTYDSKETDRDRLYDLAEDRRDAEYAPLINDHIGKDISVEEVHGITLADYVIEQGENYTKWESGKLEQWGSIDAGDLSLTRPRGNLFISEESLRIDFPYEFIKKPILTLIPDTGAIIGLYVGEAYSSGADVWPLSALKHDRGVVYSYHAIGRWKE